MSSHPASVHHSGCDTWVTSRPTAALCTGWRARGSLRGSLRSTEWGCTTPEQPVWVEIKNPAEGISLLTRVFLDEHQLDGCRSESVFRIFVYKGNELLHQSQR